MSTSRMEVRNVTCLIYNASKEDMLLLGYRDDKTTDLIKV